MRNEAGPEQIRAVIERAQANAKAHERPVQPELLPSEEPKPTPTEDAAFPPALFKPGESSLPPGASRCGSCGEAVYFAKTVNGKTMPVEVTPVPNGNVLLSKNRATGAIFAQVLGRGTPRPEGRPLRLAHWVTCPSAAKHRRK